MIGIFGIKGSGKSLLAALLAERAYVKSNRTRPILYFPDNFDHVHGSAISLAEMFTGSDRMNQAIIIWDECQVLLNKFRAASHANRSLLGFLQQIRKRGCQLYYTSNAPKQLDRALGEQTDWHCYVEKMEDRRCKNLPNHLANCRDAISCSWVDTQGKMGRWDRWRDGRYREQRIVGGLIKYYGKLYNTFATASVEEVSMMDATEIRNAHDAVNSGIPMDKFVEMMEGWIENLVLTEEPTPRWLIPDAFAKLIAKQTKGEITPSAAMVGKACVRLGLNRKRRNDGVRYELPKKIEIESGLWKSGLRA